MNIFDTDVTMHMKQAEVEPGRRVEMNSDGEMECRRRRCWFYEEGTEG